MNKNQYFIKKFGLKYTIIALIDSVLNKKFKLQNKKIHQIRTKMIKIYLKKEYSKVIEKWRNIESSSAKISGKSPIFVLWWQGLEVAPELISICINSIKRNAGNHPVVILSKENISEWIDIPLEIKEKIENGKLGLANFSDYIRSSLLYQYGGIWLDSTTYLNGSIDKYINGLSFWSVHHERFKNWHICAGKWSVSYFASAKNDPVMGFMSEMFLQYYIIEEYSMYYLLIDCILSLGYENISAIKKEIDNIPINNEYVFDLLTKINEPFNKKLFIDSSKNTVNKLTYKKELIKKINGKITNYGYIAGEISND